MRKEYARFLFEETVRNYNLIAVRYAQSRSFVSEDIKRLAEYANPGEKILDSGCANGRLFAVLRPKKVDYYGVDISEKLIKIAAENYPEAKFKTADSLNLPFPTNFFDKIYSISVLHNIPSKELRFSYLKEARRVLKPKGLLILRVWYFWRRKIFFGLILKYTFLKLIGRSRLDFKDVFLPWKDEKGRILVQRYFHCFTKKELENLIKKSGFKIKKSWKAGQNPRTNIYLIAQKS
jgi:ubiquinone/menaquinone biosynthesis C-methylase UbiE